MVRVGGAFFNGREALCSGNATVLCGGTYRPGHASFGGMMAGHFMTGKIAITPRRSVALCAALHCHGDGDRSCGCLCLSAVPDDREHGTSTGANRHLVSGGHRCCRGDAVVACAARGKFEAPGTLLQRDPHPRLFAELDDISLNRVPTQAGAHPRSASCPTRPGKRTARNGCSTRTDDGRG